MTDRAHSALKVTTRSDREIVLTRAFDAPRDLVFAAWTQPEHVRHWWGWRSSTIVLGSGMEAGAAESYDRLAEHIATLV